MIAAAYFVVLAMLSVGLWVPLALFGLWERWHPEQHDPKGWPLKDRGGRP